MPRTAAVPLALLALLLAGPASGANRNTALDLELGIYVPTDGNNRDVFGAGEVFGVGLPARIGGSSWVLLDAALIHSAGAETPPDPTFTVDDTHLWLVPLAIGWRFNAGTNAEEKSARLYLGFGLQTWLAWYDPPIGPTHFAPALGGFAEWRAEFDAGSSNAMFIHQRVFLTTKQSFGSNIPDLGFSGSTLSLGLSHRLR